MKNNKIEKKADPLEHGKLFLQKDLQKKLLNTDVLLKEYMKTYNTYRPHSSLGGSCPADYYLKSKLNDAA